MLGHLQPAHEEEELEYREHRNVQVDFVVVVAANHDQSLIMINLNALLPFARIQVLSAHDRRQEVRVRRDRDRLCVHQGYAFAFVNNISILLRNNPSRILTYPIVREPVVIFAYRIIRSMLHKHVNECAAGLTYIIPQQLR